MNEVRGFFPCPRQRTQPRLQVLLVGFGELGRKDSSPSFRPVLSCADAHEPPCEPGEAGAEDPADGGRAAPSGRARGAGAAGGGGAAGREPRRFRGSGRPAALPVGERPAGRRSPRPAPAAPRQRPAHPGAGERSGRRGRERARRGPAGRASGRAGGAGRRLGRQDSRGQWTPAFGPVSGPVPGPRSRTCPLPAAPLAGSPPSPLRPFTWPLVAPTTRKRVKRPSERASTFSVAKKLVQGVLPELEEPAWFRWLRS